MTKPHEETWERYNDPDAGDFSIRTTDGRCVLSSDEGTTFDDLNLATAAPEMARMLLDVLKNYEIGDRGDARITAILTKAGVLQ